jgi:hypothetical protein
MIDTYDLAERIQKAETVADGQAILDEALEQQRENGETIIVRVD